MVARHPYAPLPVERRARRALEAALTVDPLPAAEELRMSRVFVGLNDLRQRLAAGPLDGDELEEIQSRALAAAALLEALVALHQVDPRDADADARTAAWEWQVDALESQLGCHPFH